MKKSIVFVCSDKCQNSCLYCIVKEHWKDRLFDNALITDTNLIFKYIKLFNKYTNEICLTGFEPTLNKDIFKILEYAIANKIDYINFHTNGVLLNEDYIKKFLPFKKNLKIFISLPSASEPLYNKITNSKNFKPVFNAIRLLLENEFVFFVNIVISKLNIHDIYKTIGILRQLGVKRIIFLYVDTEKKDCNIQYSISIPILENIIEHFPEMKFQVYEIPPCLLKQYPHLRKVMLNKIATNNEFNIGKKGCVTKERYLSIMCKAKIDLCQQCLYMSQKQCNGLIKAYLKIFGDSEFKNLSAEDLR